MNTTKPIQQLISSRISCRSYDPSLIASDLIDQMKSFISILNEEANSKIRFSLMSTQQSGNEAKVKLGSYGVISGAHTYIVAITHETEGDALELGYLFEKAILKATDLGLGTCWEGGTFNKTDFEKNIKLNEKEYIPIVSPLGYAKEKRTLLDSAMRFGAGSNNRKPIKDLFFENNTNNPLSMDQAGEYAIALDMVRIGPSASNKQPWRVIKQANTYHFFLARNSGYGEMIKYDLQLNDIGIAMCHFELTVESLGLVGSWIKLEPQPKSTGWEYVSSWVIK
ncbi:MAG: nitroreductase family protein [Erysipelotrichaceae bacterium]